MKLCTSCNQTKPESDFNKRRDSLQPKCRSCDNISSKAHYKKHPEKYHKYNKDRRVSSRIFVNSLKLKCSNCTENDSCCLDFHHLHSKIKTIPELVTAGASRKVLQEEINKCIVLCANCHRKLHGRKTVLNFD